MNLTTKTAQRLKNLQEIILNKNSEPTARTLALIQKEDLIFVKNELKEIIENPNKSSDEKILDLIQMKREIESIENETKNKIPENVP